MINTYRYGGHKNLREDNTTQKLEVRPSNRAMGVRHVILLLYYLDSDAVGSEAKRWGQVKVKG